MLWVHVVGAERVRELVRACVPEDVMVLTSPRDEVPGPARSPPAAVVICASMSDPASAFRELAKSREQGLGDRTVFLAPFAREVAAWLAGVQCERLIWLDEAEQALPAVIDTLLQGCIRRRMWTALSQAYPEDKSLLKASEQAFRLAPKELSVSELAKAVPCDPATLWRHWKRCALPETPRALCDWAVLGHLADGAHLSLNQARLERIVMRRLKSTSVEVDAETILEGFLGWLLSSPP